ncbi:MAG: sel1 repeat family protein [Lentisphaeria bacterium]|nr:sel1 repeat family protein [Lentisphaeria bacterium]
MYITLRILCIAALCSGTFALAGAEKTSADAENSLLQRARSGNARAQLEAGFVFFRLNNPVRAAYWFQQAARQNLPEAQYNLARCHLEGVGVERNLHKAAEYIDLAAKQNLPEAMLSKAQLSLTGIPAAPDANPPRPAIAPDEKTAFLLLEELSQKNNAPAQFIYAEYLLKKYPSQQTKIIDLLTNQQLPVICPQRSRWQIICCIVPIHCAMKNAPECCLKKLPRTALKQWQGWLLRWKTGSALRRSRKKR